MGAAIIALAVEGVEPVAGLATAGLGAGGVFAFALSEAAGCLSLLAAFAVPDSSLASSGLRAQPAIKTAAANKSAIIKVNRPARDASSVLAFNIALLILKPALNNPAFLSR
jgi:hypothetical protein